jgi:hypothetical protein
MMGISFQIWVVVLAIGLCAVAYYAYRSTTPSLSPRVRVLLTSLRVVSFGLLAFLLLDPRYVYQSFRKDPARVVAMIDQSASMTLTAGAGEPSTTRFDRAVTASSEIARIIESKGGSYNEVFFSQDVLPVSGDTVVADGQGTALGRSLASAHRKHEGENVAAFLVLSDGVETVDRLVRHDVPPVPVFTIGLGDTSAPEDVRIKDVDYNAIVRAPSRSTIKTTLHYSGAKPKPVELRLQEGGRTVARRDTVFTPEVREIEMGMPVEFTEAGKRVFVLEAVVEGYDAEADNNRRDVVVESEKAGVRILIVDLLPEWELHFLTEFLRNDETFDFEVVSTFGRRGPQGDTAGAASRMVATLSEYDALVILSITEEFMTQEVANAITKFVRVDGHGLLILPGHASLFESAVAWTRLADLLPVRGVPPHRFNLQFTNVRPGAQAGANPITSQLVPLLSQTDWQQRSPLLGYYSPLVTKNGVDVLLETVGQRVPAFTYQTVGGGRVALLSVGPLWRWKFLSEGNKMYDEMASRLLDVLSRGEDTERFALFSRKNVYDSGETLVVTAELFDEKMQPVTGAPVRLELVQVGSDGEEVPLRIVSMQREGSDNPRYRVELPPLAAGTYRLRGEAKMSGRVVTSESVDVSVSDVSVEFQRVAQDRLNLTRIASQSGGAYSGVAGATALARRIPLESRTIGSTDEVALRTSVVVFVTILLLLAVEWIIRKRLGMV